MSSFRRGSAPDPGSVARGGPEAPLRSLAGAPCAPNPLSRREVLSQLAAAFAGAVAIDHGLAREAHALVLLNAQQAGGAAPAALSQRSSRSSG